MQEHTYTELIYDKVGDRYRIQKPSHGDELPDSFQHVQDPSDAVKDIINGAIRFPFG